MLDEIRSNHDDDPICSRYNRLSEIEIQEREIKCPCCRLVSTYHAFLPAVGKYECSICWVIFSAVRTDEQWAEQFGVSVQALRMRVVRDGVKHIIWETTMLIKSSDITPSLAH